MWCGESSKRARELALVLGVLLAPGCEVGGVRPVYVIAGPTAPSPVPTIAPYVWDTDAELRIWLDNPVTRGPVPLSLVGGGADALIRIAPRSGSEGWVLRGPDLVPPVAGVRALRIWYRWRLDPALSATASKTFTVTASFEVVNPTNVAHQRSAYGVLQPAEEWTAADLTPRSFRDTLEVKYVYLHQWSSNPGVFEIDRLELMQ